MSKKTIVLVDASNEELLAELAKRLGAAPAASTEAGASEEAEFPDKDTINDMEEDGLRELCDKVGIEHKDLDADEMKEYLGVIADVGSGENDGIDAKVLKRLLLAVGLKPGATLEERIQQLTEFLGESGDESAEDGGEESSEEAEEGEEKAEEGEEGDGEEEDGEEGGAEEESEEEASEEESAPDYAAIVKKDGKYPAEKDMVARLTAYNKVAKTKLDVKKLGGTKKAYTKLLELLVDSDESIAKWGVPYIRGEEGFCCGLPLKEVTIKGKKGQFGKCVVTGKTFEISEDGSFEAVE